MQLLNFRYKKEDLDFEDKKLENEEYYYNLNKCKSGKVIIIDELSKKKLQNNY